MLDISQLKSVNDNPELHKVLEQAYLKTDLYAKTFYQNRFSLAFTDLHQQIFDVVDAKKPDGTPFYQKIVIKAPRGIGKSSIAKTIVAKRIRYSDAHYVVYLGKTFDFAATQTENIKNGMLQNKLENGLFGSIKMKKTTDEFSDTFSKKAWMTASGCMVFPRGAEQPVRGLLFDYDGYSYRPDLYIADDLEDRLEILNPETRARMEGWFFSDVVKSVPLPGVSKNWQIIYIDTLKHSDSLLQKLLDNDEWKSVELSICDAEYNTFAPEFMSNEDIELELKEARDQPHLLDIFYQERMGLPISAENITFNKKYFQYYTEQSVDFQRELHLNEIQTCTLHDPAKVTVNPKNADTAIVSIGINTKRRKIYIRDIAYGKTHPEEQYAEAVRQIKKYKCELLGVEENSLHEFIEYPFKDYLKKEHVDVEWLNLKPRIGKTKGTGKIEKIKGLIPFYQSFMIYHEENLIRDPHLHGNNVLEGQLLQFPLGKKVDVADIVSYIIQVLAEYFVYFDSSEVDDRDFEYMQSIEDEEEDYLATVDDLPDDWRIN